MTTECLVCTILDQKVGLPIHAIRGILPLYCTFPVPCAESWVLGLGIRDCRVFTVVGPVLKSESREAPINDAHMLLSNRADSDMNWALRVNQVLGTESVTVDTTKHHCDEEWACPGDWFRPAKTLAGDPIAWLDPDAIDSSLARVGGAR